MRFPNIYNRQNTNTSEIIKIKSYIINFNVLNNNRFLGVHSEGHWVRGAMIVCDELDLQIICDTEDTYNQDLDNCQVKLVSIVKALGVEVSEIVEIEANFKRDSGYHDNGIQSVVLYFESSHTRYRSVDSLKPNIKIHRNVLRIK